MTSASTTDDDTPSRRRACTAFVLPGNLPNDGKVIDDTRRYD
jgi:hypothetical protein